MTMSLRQASLQLLWVKPAQNFFWAEPSRAERLTPLNTPKRLEHEGSTISERPSNLLIVHKTGRY